MYKPKLEKEIRCPLEYGLEIFGGKWKSRIICLLDDYSVMRYGEMRRELNGIADTVLSMMLRELIADSIIERKQYDEIPQRVEYSLTDKGMSVIPILRNICRWSGSFYFKSHQSSLAQCKSCMACHQVLGIDATDDAV